MRRFIQTIRNFVEKADMLLLFLCTVSSVFGIILISSATAYLHSRRYIIVQVGALIIGIALYVFFSLIDIEIIAERRDLLFIFNYLVDSILHSTSFNNTASVLI